MDLRKRGEYLPATNKMYNLWLIGRILFLFLLSATAYT